jgi:hypothetical protein
LSLYTFCYTGCKRRAHTRTKTHTRTLAQIHTHKYTQEGAGAEAADEAMDVDGGAKVNDPMLLGSEDPDWMRQADLHPGTNFL